jgi:hypothetical protein
MGKRRSRNEELWTRQWKYALVIKFLFFLLFFKKMRIFCCLVGGGEWEESWLLWQFEKENSDSLKREILTVWKGKF